ncbi:MAG: hypothetical protein V1784_02005 [bacterium]
MACYSLALLTAITINDCFASPQESDGKVVNASAEGLFRTKAFLSSPNTNGLSASLTLSVQNVSQATILILNDVSSINVSSGTGEDNLNDVHFDFGTNSDARLIQVANGASVAIGVLVNDDMERMVRRTMKIKAPITYKRMADDRESVILLTFDVNEGRREMGGSPKNRE